MNDAGRIEETAARWVVRREEASWSDDDAVALAGWLEESLAHKIAYWRLVQGWREADRIAALGAAPPPSGRSARRPWPAAVRSLRARSLSAVGAAVVAALAWVVLLAAPEPARVESTIAFVTPVGGRRVLHLGDGSRIDMNTASFVRTAIRAHTREVWLDRGEAFFDITHRDGERFVVHAGPRTITVLGTRFSIRRDGQNVTVAVTSGRVRVDDAVDGEANSGVGSEAVRARAAIISAGDLAVAREHSTMVVMAAPTHVEAMTAWRSGVLVFDNDTLADIAAEFNRYALRPIRIVDPRVASIRIGGSFRIDRRDDFLDLLQSAYRLRVADKATAVEIGR